MSVGSTSPTPSSSIAASEPDPAGVVSVDPIVPDAGATADIADADLDAALTAAKAELEVVKRRQAALREAAEFGMLGMLDPDAGATIGLGGTSGHDTRLGAHAPRAAIRQGALQVNGRLPPEVITRIIRQNFGRFRLCYENGLRSNPTLQGRVTTKFVIGRDGSVQTAKDEGSDMPDTSVTACVVRAHGSLSFPQPEGGIVTVTSPIFFSPGP